MAEYKMIPVRPGTWNRLRDYKMRGETWDAVLNMMMDAWPLEKVSKKILKEHERALKEDKFRPVDEVIRDLKRR